MNHWNGASSNLIAIAPVGVVFRVCEDLQKEWISNANVEDFWDDGCFFTGG
jgi:hypothetical protein